MGERILNIPKNCPFESQKYKNRVWRVEPQVDVRDGLKNPNITSIAKNRFQVKVQRTEFQAQVWRDELWSAPKGERVIYSRWEKGWWSAHC